MKHSTYWRKYCFFVSWINSNSHPKRVVVRKTLYENRVGARGWGEVRKWNCKHCFQYFIPISQLLELTGQFWLFTSTLTSITWIRARCVKQTWRGCKSFLHYTFWRLLFHTTIVSSGSRRNSGRTEIFTKETYRLSPSLFPTHFTRSLFHYSPSFFARLHRLRA